MEAYAGPSPIPAPRSTVWERLGGSIAIAVVAAALLICAYVVGMKPGEGSYLLLIPFAAVLAARHPVAATFALFILLGFSGTLVALGPVKPRAPTEFVAFALWAGVAWHLLDANRPRIWLWPAVLGPALFVFLTLIAMLLTDPISLGWESFRQSILWMSVAGAVALSPWARERNTEIAKAVIGIGLAVGLYSVYRYIVGPAADEEEAARAALPGLPRSEELRFFGSQLTAQQLALWTTSVIPVLLALMLAWRGRWRLGAAFAVGLLGFCLVATEIRTGAIACAVAVIVVLALFQLSVAFPAGTRTGATLTAMLAIVVLGVGGFTLTVGNSEESSTRFLRILTPNEDPAFSNRIQRWEDAWPLVTEKPLGQGLGTSGAVALENEYIPLTAVNLDSSYLKIGLEQGLAMMLLFGASLLVLGATLARRAVGARDPTRSALAIGACGSLAGILVMFYAGFFVENREVLMAWFLLGLGIAQFSILGRADEADGPGSPAPPAGP